MDIMEDKIKVANSTLFGRPNIEFLVGDAQKDICDKYADCINCITFIDILCYVPYEKKRGILKSFYDYLGPGGKLVIKTIKEKPLLKYWWTLFHMLTIDKLIHRGFKNNSYFRHTDRRMMDVMANNASKVRAMMYKYGIDEVENFIDICLSLENLIDRYRPYVPAKSARPENETRKNQGNKLRVDRDYMEGYINPPEFI